MFIYQSFFLLQFFKTKILYFTAVYCFLRPSLKINKVLKNHVNFSSNKNNQHSFMNKNNFLNHFQSFYSQKHSDL